MPQDLTDYKSSTLQEMAWGRQENRSLTKFYDAMFSTICLLIIDIFIDAFHVKHVLCTNTNVIKRRR